VDIHLYSAEDPESEFRWAAEVSRECLGGKKGATIACLPFGLLSAERWMDSARRAFKDVAEPLLLSSEMMELREMEGMLRGAALAFLPAGNAFLFNHRLHLARLLPYLRQKVRNGLPVLAADAGAVICGPNVLTAGDLNLVPTPHFEGLGLSPFNFLVHYEDDPQRDDWLVDYYTFHDNPVMLLEDGAYMKVGTRKTTLVRGKAWCWRPGTRKELVSPGESLAPN
jgi:peptidase E